MPDSGFALEKAISLNFLGMESIAPTNLKGVNTEFNNPGEYAAVLERLARRNVYAITSFIFGAMENDPDWEVRKAIVEAPIQVTDGLHD
jgi:hypothetical protein